MSLIQQRNIVIPSRLAQQIGLEGAVLLQTLSECAQYLTAEDNRGFQWHEIAKTKLLSLLPFWTENDVQRISDQLKDNGLIRLDSPQLALTDYYRFAFNQQGSSHKNQTNNSRTTARATSSHAMPSWTPRKRGTQPPRPIAETAPTISEPSSQPYRQPIDQSQHQVRQRNLPPSWPSLGAKNNGQLITANWQPSNDKVEQLHVLHGVPTEFCRQQTAEFVTYWVDKAERHVSWESKFHSHIVKAWQYQQIRQNQQQLKQQNKAEKQAAAAADLNNWQPSHDAVDIMLRDNVEKDFIYNAVPEFILYWRERDHGAGQWNSKFIQHVRLTWARYSATIEHDGLPQIIDPKWQPSHDAIDVLSMANIDSAFARSLVAEFVIFWHDNKQPQRSWNSKFIQWVKSQWARRHQMDTHNVSSQGNQNFTGKDQRGFVEKHTDSSWAEDL
ncbi:DnaT-like ssDNA-binding domain-containing protein [Sinobacterium norvegicum]|uniref:DnaT-like ssDNA-binding domain-containing protein n=1 Tax=Sinobacterium norvegicum TaxID=1641715 RepID=UPI001EEE44C4|nr:DnaT-like ssDNA-binding domain-containing protein [Sinobacterium norvegicum]